MTNLGHHALDIAHWFLKARGPVQVASMGGRYCLQDNGETPDTQDALFCFPGWTALWSHREAGRGSGAPSGMEFFGSKGSLTISRRGFTVMPDRQVAPGSAIPRFVDRRPPEAPTIQGPAGPVWTEALKDESGSDLGQFKLHVRNFLDCIKSRKTPNSDLESAHRVSTACHLANLSLRLGRGLRWDADKEDIVGDKEASARLVRPYRAPWDAELKALGAS